MLKSGLKAEALSQSLEKGVKLDLRATTWLTDFWTVFFYEEPLASTTPLVCVVQSNLSS